MEPKGANKYSINNDEVRLLYQNNSFNIDSQENGERLVCEGTAVGTEEYFRQVKGPSVHYSYAHNAQHYAGPNRLNLGT